MEPERASSERAILKKFAVRRRKLKIQYSDDDTSASSAEPGWRAPTSYIRPRKI